MLQSDYPVFLFFLFLDPFCYFFITYLFYFHKKLPLPRAAVEERKNNILEFKLADFEQIKI